jgi:hypothetical protein
LSDPNKFPAETDVFAEEIGTGLEQALKNAGIGRPFKGNMRWFSADDSGLNATFIVPSSPTI